MKAAYLKSSGGRSIFGFGERQYLKNMQREKTKPARTPKDIATIFTTPVVGREGGRDVDAVVGREVGRDVDAVVGREDGGDVDAVVGREIGGDVDAVVGREVGRDVDAVVGREVARDVDGIGGVKGLSGGE